MNGSPRVRYTDHAKDQMRERGYEQSDIDRVIQSPDTTYVGVDGKRNMHGTTSTGRVRVVLVPKEDYVLVITVVRLA